MSRGGGHRQVVGLVWASRGTSPWGLRVPRSGGAKAQGRRYEKALARVLGSDFEWGPWFSFRDVNGPGNCQPDFVLVGTRSVLVLEAKYTWTTAARSQIDRLYRPVLERALGLPVLGVAVCRVLTPAAPTPSGSLAGAVDMSRKSGFAVIHWIGTGPLGGQAQQHAA